MEHQKFMARLFISREMERKRGQGLGCVIVLFDKLKEGSAGQEKSFPTLFL